MTALLTSPPIPEPTLRAEQITVHLSGRPILRDISLSLGPGELVAIVGPNGCGKSTLIRSLAGLIPPSSGGIFLGDRELRAFSRRQLARRIAYMSQQESVQFPLSCLEAVLLGRSPHKRWLGLADPEDLDLTQRVMVELDVAGLGDRPVTAVSGGELQRLMFARALVQQCPFLLLDEPTSAQDPRGTLIIQQVLLRQRDGQTGILVAVHDINLALRFFDRLIVLKQGRIIQSGSPPEVLDGGALQRAFEVRLHFVGDSEIPLVVGELPSNP